MHLVSASRWHAPPRHIKSTWKIVANPPPPTPRLEADRETAPVNATPLNTPTTALSIPHPELARRDYSVTANRDSFMARTSAMEARMLNSTIPQMEGSKIDTRTNAIEAATGLSPTRIQTQVPAASPLSGIISAIERPRIPLHPAVALEPAL